MGIFTYKMGYFVEVKGKNIKNSIVGNTDFHTKSGKFNGLLRYMKIICVIVYVTEILCAYLLKFINKKSFYVTDIVLSGWCALSVEGADGKIKEIMIFRNPE